MNNLWYEEVAADVRLTQGDFIFNCPLLSWKDSSIDSQIKTEIGELKQSIEAFYADVIVMSQACDLKQEKVRNVVLCPHLSLHEYRISWEEAMKGKNQNPTEKAWKSHCEDICDGYIWNLSILNTKEKGHMKIEHRIIDFHDIYTVPLKFLESLLKERGLLRLLLLPPYREYLSQAFARFFMRVGLPVPITKII